MSSSSSSSVAVSSAKGKESNKSAMADEGDQEEESGEVTRHVCLSQSLEKEEILRRIRQRKRMTRLCSTLRNLVRSPKPASASQHTRWLDDPFTAL